MKCPRCGNLIEGKALFCPQCGRKLDLETQPLQASRSPQDPRVAPPARNRTDVEDQAPRPRGCRSGMAVAGIAFLVVLVVGLLALGAVYLGMRDRGEIQAEAAWEHYMLGEAYLADGQYELAVAEFEYALQLDPSLVEVASRLAEARALLGAEPTPTSILQPGNEDRYWEEIQTALAQQNWAVALERADQLLAANPEYRRPDVEQVIHDASYQLGLQYVEQNRMQEAVRFFDRALTMQPSSTQASLAQSMAKLYMDGVRYAGSDWASAVDRLSMLYNLDPDYRDVRARLVEAYQAYGEQLAAREDWCLAALQYRRANEVSPSQATLARAESAAERCEAPPPDQQPGFPGPDDDETTPTPGPTGPSGTYVGRLDRIESVDAAGIYVRGQVLNSDGKGVANVRIRIQAWDWYAYAISNGSGQFSFDGLGNAVPYTLSLPDLPSEPVEVPTAFTQLTWVIFEQIP
jgi:tetratricopeptide (TPR) repeat protein